MIGIDGLLLPLLVLLMTKWGDIQRKNMTPAAMALLAFTAPLVHLALGGGRWQVVPVYLLHGLIGATAIFLYWADGRYKVSIAGVRKITLFFTAVSLMAMVIFPLHIPSPPKGPYTIGTFTATLEDGDRTERYGDRAGDPRRVNVQVYYPAQAPGRTRAPLILDGYGKAKGLSRATRAPFLFISHIGSIRSDAWLDAPVATHPSKFPVILMSHGWKSFGAMHAYEAQMLASNGYIVVLVEHPYIAASTTFDDGERAYFDPNALLREANEAVFRKSAQALSRMMEQDIELVLDQLEQKKTPILGRSDMNRVGLMGHSIGGSAAIGAAMEDQRIDAVLGMDALLGALGEKRLMTGLDVPYMHIRSTDWEGTPNDLAITRLMAGTYADQWLFTIEGTKHSDFTLMPDITPLSKWMGISGHLSAQERHNIQQKLVFDFFEFSLRGRNTRYQLNDLALQYDELELVVFDRE